jgi:hypothetical protein
MKIRARGCLVYLLIRSIIGAQVSCSKGQQVVTRERAFGETPTPRRTRIGVIFVARTGFTMAADWAVSSL